MTLARIPALQLSGEEEDTGEVQATVWPFFLQHAASPWGVHHLECHTLAALLATCRAGRAALRQALRARERAVQAAGRCLYSRIAVDFLVRPTARLDDFLRLALYDQAGVKLAEAKLSLSANSMLFPWERSAFGDRTVKLAWWQKVRSVVRRVRI